MKSKKTEVARLLEKKKKICVQLLQIMQEQVVATEIPNEHQLKMIINSKEEMVLELLAIDEKIFSLVQKLDKTNQKLLVSENEKLASDIEKDLTKIIEQENFCQEKLNLVRDDMGEKIKGLKKGQTLLKGYGVSQRIKSKISENI